MRRSRRAGTRTAFFPAAQINERRAGRASSGQPDPLHQGAELAPGPQHSAFQGLTSDTSALNARTSTQATPWNWRTSRPSDTAQYPYRISPPMTLPLFSGAMVSLRVNVSGLFRPYVTSFVRFFA